VDGTGSGSCSVVSGVGPSGSAARVLASPYKRK
jgi:hypothetical protein